jgi:hypothetical protein
MDPITLSKAQFLMLRAIANRRIVDVDSRSVAVLHDHGLVAVNAPGKPLISVTVHGLLWLTTFPQGNEPPAEPEMPPFDSHVSDREIGLLNRLAGSGYFPNKDRTFPHLQNLGLVYLDPGSSRVAFTPLGRNWLASQARKQGE